MVLSFLCLGAHVLNWQWFWFKLFQKIRPQLISTDRLGESGIKLGAPGKRSVLSTTLCQLSKLH